MLKLFKHKFHNSRFKYNRTGGAVWDTEDLLTVEAVQERIGGALRGNKPYLVGKLGSNEQNLVHWAEGIPSGFPGFSGYVPAYWETMGCFTNAGARPRNKESYREISSLFVGALTDLDILPLFKLKGEHEIWKRLSPQAKACTVDKVYPLNQDQPDNWTLSLKGKKVLVVSPFEASIQAQYKRRELVWPNGALPDFELITYRFPYLVEDDCQLNWKDVYNDAAQFIEDNDVEVGLFGCGFMGLLLAHLCKKKGAVGIHLGGALQHIFGISCRRHENQKHYSKYINDDWVRPSEDEVPKCASRIENACYW